MKFCFAAAIAAMLLFTAGKARAGEIVDATVNAEQFLAQRKYDDALATLDHAKGEVWKATQMMVRKALFTASEPQGFGVYDIKEVTTFKRSEPIITHAEPVGYGFGRDGDLYVIDLGLDFVIKSPDGKNPGTAGELWFARVALARAQQGVHGHVDL